MQNDEDNFLSKHLYNEDLYTHSDDDGIDIITLRYTLL
jgi:hypothetical protein